MTTGFANVRVVLRVVLWVLLVLILVPSCMIAQNLLDKYLGVPEIRTDSFVTGPGIAIDGEIWLLNLVTVANLGQRNAQDIEVVANLPTKGRFIRVDYQGTSRSQPTVEGLETNHTFVALPLLLPGQAFTLSVTYVVPDTFHEQEPSVSVLLSNGRSFDSSKPSAAQQLSAFQDTVFEGVKQIIADVGSQFGQKSEISIYSSQSSRYGLFVLGEWPYRQQFAPILVPILLAIAVIVAFLPRTPAGVSLSLLTGGVLWLYSDVYASLMWLIGAILVAVFLSFWTHSRGARTAILIASVLMIFAILISTTREDYACYLSSSVQISSFDVFCSPILVPIGIIVAYLGVMTSMAFWRK